MTKKIVDNLLHKELSYDIHGAAIEMRKDFGPGHKEKLYQNALAKGFDRRSVAYKKEPPLKIYSPKNGEYIGLYRPDFVIDEKIIVETKAEKFVSRDEIKRMYDCLRNSKYELAYLINFTSPTLFVRRVIFTNDRKPFNKPLNHANTELKNAKRLLVSIGLLFVLFSGVSVSADSSSITVSVTDGEAFNEETIVYTAGGTASLTNTNGTMVNATAPANFYTENLRVQLTSYANDYFSSSKPEPSGVDFIGKAYDFTLRKTDGTIVSDTISQPISFTLSYISSEVSGYTESSLAPYHYNDSTSAWDAISSFVLDTSANTITFSASSFSSFAIFGTPTPASTETPAAATGGGGGGGIVAPPTEVFFYGFAYPETNVLLLKNAQVVASSRAKADASFQFSLTGISAGTHTFGIVAEDEKGNRSITNTFTVKITGGAVTTMSGILVPPLVLVDKTEVRKGDLLKIEGKALPGAEVALYLGDKGEKIKTILARVKATSAGAYSYSLATAALAQGGYAILARAEKGDNRSTLSRETSFTVGLQNKVAALFAKAPAKVDFNKDNKVNLVDFSIAAFWFKQPSPPAHVDPSGDGKVDLIDFSILAYYWTG